MMRHAWLLGLFACHEVGTVATPTPPSAAPQDASTEAATATILPIVDAAPTPRGPLRWGTQPASGAELSYVADGLCIQGDVDVLSNGAMLHYGEHGAAFAAHITHDGLEEGARLSSGIGINRADGLTGFKFHELRGTYPDNLWLEVDNGGRANSVIRYMRFDGAKWGFWGGANSTTQQWHLVPMGSGAIAASYTCPTDSDDTGNCTPGPVVAYGTTAPALGGGGFDPQRLLPFPSGAVYALGLVCHDDPVGGRTCGWQARRSKPNTKLAADVLSGTDDTLNAVIARAEDDVIITLGDRYLRFDGSQWGPLPWAGKIKGGELHAAADGSLWAIGAGAKIERRAADGTITDVSLPSPRAQADYARTPAIDGIEVGAPWAALMDGTVVRFKDGHWTPVPVPKAPFAFPGAKFNVPHAEGVRVLAADDAWVNVKYMEWPSHYSDNTREERRAFLRTLPPKETLRCTRDGFVSFPPLASPDCKTPLVIMATTPSTNSTDWPQSRKLLASSRLEGVSLIEFTAENKKILAAKVPSYDTGKKLLMALHEDNVFAAPEMVCAAPDNTRAVPLQDADASH